MKKRIGKNKNTTNIDTCLIVGMADSPHLHSWINGMAEARVFKNILIFPSDFPRARTDSWFDPGKNSGVRVRVIRLIPSRILNFYLMHIIELILGKIWRSKAIWYLVKRYKPSVVHYHEMQHGGYLLNTLSDNILGLNESKPLVIGSTWGSDLTFFGYIDSHAPEIRKLLDLTSVITAERSDEVKVLEKFNYRGKFFAPIYISVGTKTESFSIEPNPGARDIILVRGYQHDQGRALNALKALEGLEEVKKFKVRIFSAAKSPSVALQANRLQSLFGYDIKLLPKLSHTEFLKIFCESRIYIGLSESDGLSTSMVEAMANGCFPIQSINSAAPHFIQDGVSGFVVDPWDISRIKEAIQIALTSDKLVDAARITNRRVILEKYNWNSGVNRIKQLYEFDQESPNGKTGGRS
jgi:glycosyltransferase involved in cell wall biosynthesis